MRNNVILPDGSNMIFISSQSVPSIEDRHDAIEHASQTFGEDLDIDDFILSYLGMKSVDDLYEYDDLSGWLELQYEPMADIDDNGELEYFRGEEWAERAREWFDAGGLPPVIVVELPDGHTLIGDGRGRINVANMFGMKVPTYMLSPIK